MSERPTIPGSSLQTRPVRHGLHEDRAGIAGRDDCLSGGFASGSQCPDDLAVGVRSASDRPGWSRSRAQLLEYRGAKLLIAQVAA